MLEETILEGHLKEGELYPEKCSPHEAAHEESSCESEDKVDHFAVAYFFISDGHLLGVEEGPAHELRY